MSQKKKAQKIAEIKKEKDAKIRELVELYHFKYHVSCRQTAKNIKEIDDIKVHYSTVTNMVNAMRKEKEASKTEEV